MAKAQSSKAAPKLALNKASKGIAKAEKKNAKKEAVKKAAKKINIGEFFSCHQYMKVISIQGSTIKLRNERGRMVDIDKQVLVDDSYSADHFETEVTCNMTELSEILQSAQDTIFKVRFFRKVDEKIIAEKLQAIKKSDIQDMATLNSLAKSLTEGEEVEMVAHLVKGEQHMGRSLVIDLEVNDFRQVDHRSIQWIIFRNVKYSLGRKSTLSTLEKKEETAKWNQSKLKEGNWFSECQYYKVKGK